MPSDKPEFVHTDLDTVIQEMITDWENRTGRTLQPAQVERELINAWAYREVLLRSSINEAALQNLVDFSSAPVLDYLAALVGVTRLPAEPAKCTLQFTLVDGHGGVTIPAGTRVETTDGAAIFETTADREVEEGTTTVNVLAEAQSGGTSANGYVAGQVSVILDPQAYISDVESVDETAGGAVAETDEGLRDRIKRAPDSYSNAGSRGAYEFYAKSANPAIIDVSVQNPLPGEVEVYPLLEGGAATPQAVLDDVAATLNDDKIRPLTDTVTVLSPNIINYDVTISYDMISGGDAADITAGIEAAVDELTAGKLLRMGRDITASEIVAAAMIEDVYDVTVEIDLQSGGTVSKIDVARDEVAVAGVITANLNTTVEG